MRPEDQIFHDLRLMVLGAALTLEESALVACGGWHRTAPVATRALLHAVHIQDRKMAAHFLERNYRIEVPRGSRLLDAVLNALSEHNAAIDKEHELLKELARLRLSR